MKSQKVWQDSDIAKYYDLIYSWKNYKKESEKVHSLIKKFKKSKGNELLDVGCGTGNHIKHLKMNYKTTGIDASRNMLKIARRKFPKIKFFQANMVNFDLKKKFDIITCLFNSITLIKTYSNLEKTVYCFSKHLKPGGAIIIQATAPKTFKSGELQATFFTKPDIKIARIILNKKKGNVGIFDYNLVIATKRGVRYLKYDVEHCLFNVGRFLKILEKNGFNAKFLKNGLTLNEGLYVGVKI